MSILSTVSPPKKLSQLSSLDIYDAHVLGERRQRTNNAFLFQVHRVADFYTSALQHFFNF